MPKIFQDTQVVPPQDPKLGQQMSDFSSGVQGNMDTLYGGAHSHEEFNVAPTDAQGSVGDIELVNDGTNQYLYVRFSSGWKRFVSA